MIFVFFVVSTNLIFAQKKDATCCNSLSCFPNTNRLPILFTSDTSLVSTDSLFVIIYPIVLTDNSLFSKAICQDDFESLIQSETTVSRLTFPPDFKAIKGYYILSLDGIYIKYGSLTETNTELYATYNPFKEEDNNSTVIKTKNKQKLMYWIKQEMSNGLLVSVGAKTKGGYVAKSFKSL